MIKKPYITILKVFIPVLSITLGGLYVWKTQISHKKPKALPSSKNLRMLASEEDQYFLEIEAESVLDAEEVEPTDEEETTKQETDETQAVTIEERLFIPSSKSMRILPSSKSGIIFDSPQTIPLSIESDTDEIPADELKPDPKEEKPETEEADPTNVESQE